MIKYDYREVIERSEEQGQQRLRRILDAFVDDKRSIQKSAIVRIVGGVAESTVATVDRNKKSPDIGEYFSKFLDVHRTRSNEELNRALVVAIKDAVVANVEHLPSKDPARAAQRVKAILREREQIDEEAVIEAILAAADHPEDPVIRAALSRKTVAALKSKKLSGLSFAPVPVVLRKPSTKRIRTTEGVVLMYPADVDAVRVNRVKNVDGRGETITITTDQIVEDTVIEERS